MNGADSGEHVIYLVEGDVQNFQSLVIPLAGEEFERVPGLGGRPVADEWVPPPVISEDSSLPEPDIWRVGTLPKSFAMTPSVIERLEPFLSAAGELLSLRFASNHPRELYALNVLHPTELRLAIDVTASESERRRKILGYEGSISDDEYELLLRGLEEGDPWPVLTPEFVEENLGSVPTFFKLTRLAGMIFLLDHVGDDTLLRRIELLGVTGLVFHRVWSTEGGPEPINLFRL